MGVPIFCCCLFFRRWDLLLSRAHLKEIQIRKKYELLSTEKSKENIKQYNNNQEIPKKKQQADVE